MIEEKRHPVREYFFNIWSGISTTYAGMRLTIRYFFKPKVTMEYPEIRPEIPSSHRGIHKYVEAECGLCRACETNCPVDCFAIESVGKGKDGLVTRFDIDYSKCLFCNICCEVCNTGCLYLGEEYDLATSSREGCVLHFARTKTLEEIEAHKKLLAEKEAARKAEKEAAAKKKDAEEKKEL